MDERDFATADVPAAIAELKADFAYAARKADLNTLSSDSSSVSAARMADCEDE